MLNYGLGHDSRLVNVNPLGIGKRRESCLLTQFPSLSSFLQQSLSRVISVNRREGGDGAGGAYFLLPILIPAALSAYFCHSVTLTLNRENFTDVIQEMLPVYFS